MEIKEMNIFQKMSAITEEITRVAKNLNVGVGKSQYKAVGEADVLNAVKPIEIKYGVYSYPIKRNVIDTNILTTKTEYDGNVTEKNQLFMRIETTYRFINTDKPEEFVDITTYGDGVDSQDKAPGKAMTYSDKYALLKAYKIETGEDPDQKASETLVKVDKSKIVNSKEQVQEKVAVNTNVNVNTKSFLLGGDYVLSFGKYKDKTLRYIYEEVADYEYINWLKENADAEVCNNIAKYKEELKGN